MNRIKLAIHGAAGRMGQRLVALATEDPGLDLVAAIEQPGHPRQGDDCGLVAGIGSLGLPLSESTDEPLDALIDFSSPSGAEIALDFCMENETPLVMATTGLDEAVIARLEQASQRLPIVWAPNMSLAVNLTMKLAEIAARSLKDLPGGVDVEILERHHRFKKDAPSGTALKFGELIAAEMGLTLHRHGREGMLGERPRNEIAYHAIRAGDDAGQHTIVFGMPGETIELRVAASNRDGYAAGALAAAKYLQGKSPGLYSMMDVLGL